MRGRSANSLGSTDIPIGLIITAVITSLVVPVVWSAYSDLSVNMTVEVLEEEIADLLRMVKAVMGGGEGSTLEIEMDIDHWGSSKVETVVIGGAFNDSHEKYIVSYEVSDHERGFLSLDPPIPMISIYEDGGLVLTEGNHKITLKHGIMEDVNVCWIQMRSFTEPEP